MKGILFTMLAFLLVLVIYKKFVEPKIANMNFGFSQES